MKHAERYYVVETTNCCLWRVPISIDIGFQSAERSLIAGLLSIYSGVNWLTDCIMLYRTQSSCIGAQLYTSSLKTAVPLCMGMLVKTFQHLLQKAAFNVVSE